MGRRRPSPALVVALVALFVALGGTSYAAFSLPKNSVGTAQIKSQAVTKAKIAKKTVAALRGHRGPRGATGPAGPTGPTGPAGPQGASGYGSDGFFSSDGTKPALWGQITNPGSTATGVVVGDAQGAVATPGVWGTGVTGVRGTGTNL